MAKQYRCVGQVFRVIRKGECPDVTEGELYLLKMDKGREELFFYDDAGEKNYAVSGDPTPG